MYAGDRGEPMHIPIDRDDKIAKFWLDPILLSKSRGFRSSELTELHHIIEDHVELLLEKWYEYFSR